jgi:hypothetical protein
VEQYCYWSEQRSISLVPIFHVQTYKNWYAETRYNYEEIGAFSLYAGHNFSKESKLSSYSVTPIIGQVVGNYKGTSFGLNAAFSLGNFFFSSQSQYTMASSIKYQDFLFSWDEIGFQPMRWFYFGASVQHTFMVHQNDARWEPGAMIGFTIGNYTFPIYGFSLQNDSRYFVLGINMEIQQRKHRN